MIISRTYLKATLFILEFHVNGVSFFKHNCLKVILKYMPTYVECKHTLATDFISISVPICIIIYLRIVYFNH